MGLTPFYKLVGPDSRKIIWKKKKKKTENSSENNRMKEHEASQHLREEALDRIITQAPWFEPLASRDSIKCVKSLAG